MSGFPFHQDLASKNCITYYLIVGRNCEGERDGNISKVPSEKVCAGCAKQTRFMLLTLGEGIRDMNIYKEYHKDCHILHRQ